MAMTSSQVKREQQQNMTGPGTGWPRRNSQNSVVPTTPTQETKFPASTAVNRIINL